MVELNLINEAYKIISTYAKPTPVMTSQTLDDITEAKVFVKCENFQKGGAFKFRGAFHTIFRLSDTQKQKGVITHSSGNHAQAVAISGNILGIKTVIVMPSNAPQVKINATKGYGAEVVFCEPTQQDRQRTCAELIEEHGYTLVHPYDNDNIITGAATAALELLNKVGELDTILTPVGGGGLLCGTAIYSKLSEKVSRVIACEPRGADDAYRSYKTGKLVSHQVPSTIADGLRTTLSERTFRYIQTFVDDIVRVSEDEIVEAVAFLMERMKMVVEPSGAVPVAALLSKKLEITPKSKIGVIISGGNMDLSAQISALHRMVSELNSIQI